MAKRTIMAVGAYVPHPEIENVDIDTKRSLADGDIIFSHPNLFLYPYEDYQGKPCLGDARSFQIKETISHWRQQILTANQWQQVSDGSLKEVLLDLIRTVTKK
jgi:hypothetical protein